MNTQTLPTKFIASAVALLVTFITLVPFASAVVVLNPFTPAEVATYVADRTFPSGGVGSVSYAGRNDVLEINIDKDNRSAGSGFYYTEGVKKADAFGTELSADLYVDSDWEEKDVRAGLWGVAVDASSVITSYPIIEFSTARSDASTGWRVWDQNQWVNLETDFAFDEWSGLTITIEGDAIYFTINGEEVGSTPLNGTVTFDEIIFNSYNYGASADSYSVNWHVGIADPVEKSECKDGSWETSGFKNQGQCVKFVETGKDSR